MFPFFSLFSFLSLAIDGKTTVDKGLYPNASSDQLKVRGYYEQFPGQESLKPCTTKYSRQASSYEIFLSKFSFAVPVNYNEDTEVNGIPMHRYVLQKSAIEVNNVNVLKKGVFDVSRVSGGPIFLSLPRFLYGDSSLYKELNLPEPEAKKHESFVSIETINSLCRVKLTDLKDKKKAAFYRILVNTQIDLEQLFALRGYCHLVILNTSS